MTIFIAFPVESLQDAANFSFANSGFFLHPVKNTGKWAMQMPL
jgi:hypothetical protein